MSDEEVYLELTYTLLLLSVFNAIVRMCLSQVPGVLASILDLAAPKEGKKAPLPSSAKKWNKARMDVKSYIGDVMQVGETYIT